MTSKTDGSNEEYVLFQSDKNATFVNNDCAVDTKYKRGV